MNISKIQTTPNFYNTQKPQKREFIDIISDNVRNPREMIVLLCQEEFLKLTFILWQEAA